MSVNDSDAESTGARTSARFLDIIRKARKGVRSMEIGSFGGFQNRHENLVFGEFSHNAA